MHGFCSFHAQTYCCFQHSIASLQTMKAIVGKIYDLIMQSVVKIAKVADYQAQVRGMLGHMLVFAGKYNAHYCHSYSVMNVNQTFKMYMFLRVALSLTSTF